VTGMPDTGDWTHSLGGPLLWILLVSVHWSRELVCRHTKALQLRKRLTLIKYSKTRQNQIQKWTHTIKQRNKNVPKIPLKKQKNAKYWNKKFIELEFSISQILKSTCLSELSFNLNLVSDKQTKSPLELFKYNIVRARAKSFDSK